MIYGTLNRKNFRNAWMKSLRRIAIKTSTPKSLMKMPNGKKALRQIA